MRSPSLPGCIAHGATKEEALRDARSAIEAWVAASRQVGREIPEDTLSAEICATRRCTAWNAAGTYSAERANGGTIR